MLYKIKLSKKDKMCVITLKIFGQFRRLFYNILIYNYGKYKNKKRNHQVMVDSSYHGNMLYWSGYMDILLSGGVIAGNGNGVRGVSVGCRNHESRLFMYGDRPFIQLGMEHGVGNS